MRKEIAKAEKRIAQIARNQHGVISFADEELDGDPAAVTVALAAALRPRM